MTYSAWMAVIVVIGTVYALVKRYETRLVLLSAGFLMAILSLNPLMAFKQFDASMTNSSLIIAICSAMGFAAVISITGCDRHLVTLLINPLRKLGIVLLPSSMIVTSALAAAIPTMGGLCAAVGPTIVPILVRAGFKPAAAAASVAACMGTAYLNPGLSHNPFIAKIANMDVMTFIGLHINATLIISACCIIGVTLTCFLMHDYDPKNIGAAGPFSPQESKDEVFKPNVIYAIAPVIPIAILVVCAIWFPQWKVSVATAMVIGSVYAMLVTRTNPETAIKRFFNGMGNGYDTILGIIIAAGVFAAGLRAAGLVDILVEYLKHSNEVAKLGGAIGPFALALITGSGDAATFAFNEAVTPFAEQFGMTIDSLGYLAMMAGCLGRMGSPLAGGVILISGIAMVTPIETVKRTIPSAFIVLAILYIIC
ncbi:MAG TPA: C4-dicarboxylate transporter DcuC [Candidatus Aphodousia gallistercoris]|nr:C4-dicarboxylate transporter DcuC [Candidatus Aphodousia gallistercoris]